jgi:endonuclease/exonuclease/phosphatase (EEP) superfamily protein YafD
VPPTSPRQTTASPPLARDLLLALYPAALVVLTLVSLLAPQREGGAALAQVFAHFLFLPALLLAPLALGRDMFLLRLALAAAAAAFLLAYPPALRLPPAPPAAPALKLLTWNVFVGGVEPAAIRQALADHRPDVVTLQEALLDEIAEDGSLAAAYPYRLVDREQTAPGMAILSRFPIVEAAVPPADEAAWDMPRIVWARLDVGGRTVTVVNAHPIPPRTFEEGCSLLRCYNAGPRDAQIADVRRVVEELRRRTGDPLILAGDMNVTEREPAYLDLSRGLRDAHREAGVGFGATWRPAALGLATGLLRIDYIFTDPQLRPLTLREDCALRGSDHCLVVGSFAFEDAPRAAAGP